MFFIIIIICQLYQNMKRLLYYNSIFNGGMFANNFHFIRITICDELKI